MRLTLDSSVIVAALQKQESRHRECRDLLEKVQRASHTVLESVIVPVEVSAAIRRRTGSESLTREVWQHFLRLPSFLFVELTWSRMESAISIAEKTGLRGMDAIVVQVAEETGATLVTLDDEMAERSKGIVDVRDIARLLHEIGAREGPDELRR